MRNLPRFNLVIGLTGPIASGKGMAVKAIKETYPGRTIQFVLLSDYLREVVRAKGRPLTRETLREVGNNWRRERGSGALVLEMMSRLPQERGDILVVDSIRNPGEIAALREAFPEQVFILAMDENIEVRIQRTLKRRREEDGTDSETVRRDMLVEMEEEPQFGFSLRECRELADSVSLGKESKTERIAEIREALQNFMESLERGREFQPPSNTELHQAAK